MCVPIYVLNWKIINHVLHWFCIHFVIPLQDIYFMRMFHFMAILKKCRMVKHFIIRVSMFLYFSFIQSRIHTTTNLRSDIFSWRNRQRLPWFYWRITRLWCISGCEWSDEFNEGVLGSKHDCNYLSIRSLIKEKWTINKLHYMVNGKTWSKIYE